MKEMLEINSLFYDFIVVTLSSLIIGLEQRRHHMEEEEGSDLLFGTDIPLGIIPAGTLNHFAKDNNIPLTLKESIKLIVSGKVTNTDIAMLNDTIFITFITIFQLYINFIQRESLKNPEKSYC